MGRRLVACAVSILAAVVAVGAVYLWALDTLKTLLAKLILSPPLSLGAVLLMIAALAVVTLLYVIWSVFAALASVCCRWEA